MPETAYLSKFNLGDGVERTIKDENAVSIASQSLTDEQKLNARNNIGLGTASTRSVPTSGNANATQCVLGSDSRLNNARPCADNFIGTMAEWDALSSSEKNNYRTLDIIEE